MTMKTQNEIEDYLHIRIESILKRPRMYVDSPLGIETMALQLMDVCNFILGLDLDIMKNWREFSSSSIGKPLGALPTSTYLIKEGKLDEYWTQLTTMLEKFYMIYICGD